MKNINIKARVKRNKFDILAGESFIDENSQLIKKFNDNNQKAFIGIQSKKGLYTIIGEKFVYYQISSGEEGKISHTNFLKILSNNAMKLGKTGDFEFVKINERDSIWVLNGPTMNAMWNIIMLLNKNN